MSSNHTRYYIRRGDDGSVIQLSRIIWDDDGIWGQFWRDGLWIDNNSVVDYLLEGDGEDVNEQQAQTIAEALLKDVR